MALLIAAVAISEWRLEKRSHSLKHDERVDSPEWFIEDQKIMVMDIYKVRDINPVQPYWHSDGLPVSEEKPSNIHHRILVLGDSFVWGDGCANVNDLWWRQLQRELNRRGYWDVDVVATGVNGAATSDEFVWLQRLNLVTRLHADFVLWGYVSNDAEPKGADVQKGPKQLKLEEPPKWMLETNWGSAGTLLCRCLPVISHELDKSLVRAEEYRQASPDAGYPYDEWELKLLEGECFDIYKKLLAEVGGYVRTSAVPCVFFTVPNRPDASYFQPRYQAVAPEFQKAGLPFHNILAAFTREYPGWSNPSRWMINPANAHPGPATTHFFAVQAADLLEHDYPAVLGPKSPPPQISPVINDWMPPWMQVHAATSNQWHLFIPGGDVPAPALSMPIGKPYALFSFAHPVNIDRVQVAFSKPFRASLYVTREDPRLGYDPDNLEPLGERSGTTLEWSIPAGHGPVNTLRVAGDFMNSSEDLKVALTIIPSPTTP